MCIRDSYVVNQFEWNADGTVKSQRGPVIHSLNKDDTTLDAFPEIFAKIKHRTNVVLLGNSLGAVSYTHLRAHETVLDLVCRLLLEKKKLQL